MWMLPAEIVSRPATQRSSVDLPQPEGPTMTTNSPSATSRSTVSIATCCPYNLRTPRSATRAIAAIPLALFLGLDHALDEPPVHQQHHQGRRQEREDRRGHHEMPFGGGVAPGDQPLDAVHDGTPEFLGGDHPRAEKQVTDVNEAYHDEARHERTRPLPQAHDAKADRASR